MKNMARSHLSSLQIVLISTGILSLALFLKVSVPLVVDFSVYRAPLLWSSILSWLKPPYLYVILNFIIITIAATSCFHHGYAADHDKDQQHEHIPVPKIAIREPDIHYEMNISASEKITSDFIDPQLAAADVVYELKEEKDSAGAESVDDFVDTSTVLEDELINVPVPVEDKVDEDELFITKSTWIPTKRMDSSENLSELLLLPTEKPLVSSRFGHRKPLKASTEGGRALRVSKPKRHETLENTWKMITEGRPMPLTRHMKKSETFDHGCQVNANGVDQPQWKKSETFRDRTNHQPPSVNNSFSSPSSSVKLRKEPSLSQDELNRKVEAFIKKFNEEMRMQRQESLNQYKEMINRGAH